ncbi:hypothetical protein SLA2020_351160 [Shorea laevis]
MGDLYALDFDGVLCDSCGESSLSAVKAAKVRWPSLFDGVDSTTEDWIVDQMHTVRPVVETGYENLLLVRLLLEMRIPSIRKSSVAEGLTVDGILENWSKLKPVIMEAWAENRDPLIDLFGKVRDEWMEKDFPAWIGAIDANFIVTFKFLEESCIQGIQVIYSHHETEPICRCFTPGACRSNNTTRKNIWSWQWSQGRSAEAASEEPEHQGLTLHFVEDRLATLKNVIKEPELDGWNWDWGYNTQKEREEAATFPRIRLLELSDFSKKLK